MGTFCAARPSSGGMTASFLFNIPKRKKTSRPRRSSGLRAALAGGDGRHCGGVGTRACDGGRAAPNSLRRVGCVRSIELAHSNLSRKPPRPPKIPTAMTGKRFPPPWSIEDLGAAFVGQCQAQTRLRLLRGGARPAISSQACGPRTRRAGWLSISRSCRSCYRSRRGRSPGVVLEQLRQRSRPPLPYRRLALSPQNGALLRGTIRVSRTGSEA